MHLTITSPTYIPLWGTRIQTPSVSADQAYVSIETKIAGLSHLAGRPLRIETKILSPEGKVVAERTEDFSSKGADSIYRTGSTSPLPSSGDINQPNLYKYAVTLSDDSRVIDRDTTTSVSAPSS